MQSKAEKYLAAAKMAGKVSVTKLTSGDPLEAAENYHKAGKAFKVAGMHPQAMHAFEKAQRQYAQCGALSHAARRVTSWLFFTCGEADRSSSHKFSFFPTR